MGTDIYYRFHKQVDGTWKDLNVDQEDFQQSPYYIGRDYEFFAFLADVRNRFDIKPISSPRGLPEWLELDSDNRWGYGDHSYSYVTLKEFFEHLEKAGSVSISDVVPLEQYLAWDKSTPFDAFCQGIGGPLVKVVEAEHIEGIRRKGITDYGAISHVRAHWKEPLKESCSHSISVLEKARDTYGEDVVFVFGFDC